MTFSKGSVMYNIALFVFLFNLGNGIINDVGVFTSYMDPDVFPGLTSVLCITGPPDGFGGEWKNVRGAGYKCYLNGKQLAVSDELIDEANMMVQNNEKLFEANQNPSTLQTISNLGGSFGNWLGMAQDAFKILYITVFHPAQILLTLWPCPDATFEYSGNFGDAARNEVCTSNPDIDSWEGVVQNLQYGLQFVYILTAIQFVSNRTFRGID